MANGITIDEAKCTGCMLCMQICTLGNFGEGSDGSVHATDSGYSCFGCGHCVAICPTGAISHAELDSSKFEKLDESARLPFDRLLAFLKLRRSRREFKYDPVPREEIDKLFLAAVQAPSATNNQSVLFTAVTDREVIKKISDECVKFSKKMAFAMRNPIMKTFFKLTARAQYDDLLQFLPLIDCMVDLHAKGVDMVTYDAPCLILLHAPKYDSCAALDAVYNAENILLAVETLGLGACEIGFVTEPANRGPQIKDLARIPRNHKVFSSIVVGCPKFKYSRTVPKNPPTVNYI